MKYLLIIIILLVVWILSAVEKSDQNNPHFKTYVKFNSNAAPPLQLSTPATFYKQVYNYPAQQRDTVKPVICIISLGGTYSTTDLTMYRTSSGITTPFVAPIFHKVGNVSTAPNQSFGSPTSLFFNYSVENTLDLEIITTMCPYAEVHFFSGINSYAGFSNTINQAKLFLKNLSNDKCKIISISWGLSEIYQYIDNLLQFELVLADCKNSGITVCAASGDYASTDGTRVLSVDYPSSSPHVVSVGGTKYSGTTTYQSNQETAWSNGGGGASYFFPMPSHQKNKNVEFPQAFENYTSNFLKGSKFLENRSVPDLALNADPTTPWSIIFNKKVFGVGGTSAAAPAFAAYLGLVNKPSSRYNESVNVLTKLYDATEGFNDITTGSNDDIYLGLDIYNAKAGFDQCTGLGSINGTTLMNYL